MPTRHLLSLMDCSASDLDEILVLAERLKADWSEGRRDALLPGRVIALLFEKPSLRTRVSFEVAITHLGGNSLFLGKDVGWGERESAADFGQVLGQYVDAVVVRTRSHARLVELAAYCDAPVVNGLSELAHPCQALADLFTMREVFGALGGLKLAFVGDANNVARSLAVACGLAGVEFALAAPNGYRFESEFLDRLAAKCPDSRTWVTDKPTEAAEGAHVVYTDVWTSMGQEEEEADRRRAFSPFQVDAALMRAARADARFMHCLPARRGEEVSGDVIDGDQSVVVPQAANRLHLQKGLLAWLLGPNPPRGAAGVGGSP
ncbi:MAG: ornithine carbamoyltransferase [Planctomycetes bacterium]|nr:ornithine carbamoyltransferase [Planctomycetota bacterium]